MDTVIWLRHLGMCLELCFRLEYDLNYFKFKFITLNFLLHTHYSVCVCVCRSDRGQPVDTGSLHGSWGSNSGCTLWQASLPTEP